MEGEEGPRHVTQRRAEGMEETSPDCRSEAGEALLWWGTAHGQSVRVCGAQTQAWGSGEGWPT